MAVDFESRDYIVPEEIITKLENFEEIIKTHTLEELKEFYKKCSPHYAKRFNVPHEWPMRTYYALLKHNQILMEIERREGRRK